MNTIKWNTSAGGDPPLRFASPPRGGGLRSPSHKKIRKTIRPGDIMSELEEPHTDGGSSDPTDASDGYLRSGGPSGCRP